KDYNPNMILLQYYDMAGVSSEFVNTFIAYGWLLKDSSGNYLQYGNEYVWDIGNPNAQQWVANFLENNELAHPSLDGVRFDNSQPTTDFFYDVGFSPPINPRTGSTWTDQQVCDAMVSLIN